MSDGWTREYVVEIRHAELIAGSPFSNPYREEIVRCRDCRYVRTCDIHYQMELETGKSADDGFCAWSERIEND